MPEMNGGDLETPSLLRSRVPAWRLALSLHRPFPGVAAGSRTVTNRSYKRQNRGGRGEAPDPPACASRQASLPARLSTAPGAWGSRFLYNRVA